MSWFLGGGCICMTEKRLDSQAPGCCALPAEAFTKNKAEFLIFLWNTSLPLIFPILSPFNIYTIASLSLWKVYAGWMQFNMFLKSALLNVFLPNLKNVSGS